ncbi:iron-containing alcohol dehydrogenase [Clostridium ljungdahlii]|uniref:iron-containing alcohol dehydrogenase n=1 Tax=Clostridium ljungdahlii TaxID=1538 RepID=UPI001FA6FABD|nr:iron-containing alcohol dehydrogenase [Clostridium ljungdahlii]
MAIVALAVCDGGIMAGSHRINGMEHPVSDLYDAVHGKGLAALTPIIVEKSWKSDIEKYDDISKLIGCSSAKNCADAIRSFLEKINLNVTLGELGVKEKDVEWMSENCMKVSKPSIINHPREFTLEEIKNIYYEEL